MSALIAGIAILLHVLPAVVAVALVASDLYWGVQWFGYALDRPIYRDERPVLYWSLEALQIIVAASFLVRTIIDFRLLDLS